MHARTHAHIHTHISDEALVTRHGSTYRCWMCYRFFALISRDVIRNGFEHNRKEDFAPSGLHSLVFRSVQCCNITTIDGTRTVGLYSCISVHGVINHEVWIIHTCHNFIRFHDYYKNTRTFLLKNDMKRLEKSRVAMLAELLHINTVRSSKSSTASGTHAEIRRR